MSSAASSVATEILQGLGFAEVDGNEVGDLGLPADLEEHSGFPMEDYHDESSATKPFVRWLEDQLKEQHVPIGVPDGFKVVDMRSGEKLELIYDGVVYRGSLDAGIVPLGVAGFPV